MTVNDPRVDDRPPAFGCGKSFGMLGPTRVVVTFSSAWAESPHLAQCCLTFQEQFHTDVLTYCIWSCLFANGDSAYFSIRLDNPHLGVWVIGAEINCNALGQQKYCKLERFNFEWGFGNLLVDVPVVGTATAIANRIAEWQTVTERFPSCSFSDIP